MKLYWNFEAVKIEAKKYQYRSDFCIGSNGAYDSAKRNGWMDEVCSHMEKKKKWTKKKLIAEAKKYKTRKEFRLKKGGAYRQASDQKILDEICSHMENPFRWTKELAIKKAKEYMTKNEFKEDASGCWEFAKREGDEFFNKITEHMTILWEPKWDFNATKIEALKYATRKEFDNKNTSAYQAARKNNWLDQICTHMVNGRGVWMYKENVLKEAKKYKSRKAFAEFCGGAYNSARVNNWLDEVCSHMEIYYNGYYHCSYVIKNENLKLAYVGITSKKFEERMDGHKSKSNNTNSKKISNLKDTQFIQISDYIYAAEDIKDLKVEKNLAVKFIKEGYKILNDSSRFGSIGNSEKKWSLEKILKESKKYQRRIDFRNYSNSAYQAAMRYDLIDHVCSHMQSDRKIWFKDEALDESKKYLSIQDLKAKNIKLYRALHRRGWMPFVRVFLPKLHTLIPRDPQTGRYLSKNSSIEK